MKNIFSLPWLYIMTLTCFTELYMWLLVFKMTLTFLTSLLHLKSLLTAQSIKCYNHQERGSRSTKEEQLSKAQVSQLFLLCLLWDHIFSLVRKNQFIYETIKPLPYLRKQFSDRQIPKTIYFNGKRLYALLLLSKTNKSYEYVFTAKLLVK